MWTYNYSQNELYHHGILGQKWGKRKGPPYPLDANQHTSSEKKAGWKRSLGGGRNESNYAENKKGNVFPSQKTSKSVQNTTKEKSVNPSQKSSNTDKMARTKKIAARVGIAALNAAFIAGNLKSAQHSVRVVKNGAQKAQQIIRMADKKKLMYAGLAAAGTATAGAVASHFVRQQLRKDPNSRVSIKERAQKGYQVERSKNIASATNKQAESSAKYGAADKYTKSKYDTQMYTELSKNAKTKLGKRINAQKAQNAKYDMEYYSKVKSSGEPAAKTYLKDKLADISDWDRPYQRLSGRTTTQGEKWINGVTMGTYGLAKDAAYLARRKKKK